MNFRRAFITFAALISSLATKVPQSLFAPSLRNVFMQNHDNSYFPLNLLSLTVQWATWSTLPSEHLFLLSLLLDGISMPGRSAETPFEVNVTGWPTVASCDQLVPCSWQKALSSPQLSGISYPTSFLIYRSVVHYPGAKLTAHFHGCHLRERLGFLPQLSSSLTFWQAAGQNYLGTCISVCTLKSSFATATHGRKGQWMSN